MRELQKCFLNQWKRNPNFKSKKKKKVFGQAGYNFTFALRSVFYDSFHQDLAAVCFSLRGVTHQTALLTGKCGRCQRRRRRKKTCSEITVTFPSETRCPEAELVNRHWTPRGAEEEGGTDLLYSCRSTQFSKRSSTPNQILGRQLYAGVGALQTKRRANLTWCKGSGLKSLAG